MSTAKRVAGAVAYLTLMGCPKGDMPTHSNIYKGTGKVPPICDKWDRGFWIHTEDLNRNGEPDASDFIAMGTHPPYKRISNTEEIAFERIQVSDELKRYFFSNVEEPMSWIGEPILWGPTCRDWLDSPDAHIAEIGAQMSFFPGSRYHNELLKHAKRIHFDERKRKR